LSNSLIRLQWRGDERWTEVTGLTTNVPNTETIREAAVCQKKKNYDQKKERPRNFRAARHCQVALAQLIVRLIVGVPLDAAGCAESTNVVVPVTVTFRAPLWEACV
jgi:hypothetical protein